MSRDTRSRRSSQEVGLDVGSALIRFATGKENLHYGIWDGLEVILGNLGRAQEAYTERLFAHLPGGRTLNVLDIGGGAGEQAAALAARGHNVTIIVPSPVLAKRAQKNTGGGVAVHECPFEAYSPSPPGTCFDVCLFSESLQYIPLESGLAKAASLLHLNGSILVADCFRSAANRTGPYRRVGGGHPLSDMRAMVAELNLEIVAEEDITAGVAPTVELEQAFYNVIGFCLSRTGLALEGRRALLFRLLKLAYWMVFSAKRRAKIERRLFQTTRTAEEFKTFNRYLIFRLRRGHT